MKRATRDCTRQPDLPAEGAALELVQRDGLLWPWEGGHAVRLLHQAPPCKMSPVRLLCTSCQGTLMEWACLTRTSPDTALHMEDTRARFSGIVIQGGLAGTVS